MIQRLMICSLLLVAAPLHGEEKILPQDWDYTAPMRPIVAAFTGKRGVVLHVGDSITYSNPYGQWARNGAGKTDADKAVLKWMNLGKDDDSDGWWLCRFDHPAGGRSHTACSGLRLDELLAGGRKQMLPLEKMLDTYQPQVVVFMLGTNDASAQRKVESFEADFRKAVDIMLAKKAVPIVSTIPPHPSRTALAASYNAAIRKVAKEKGLPLIDYEKEILSRNADDWNGTLLGKNDVHPTSASDGATAASAPTAENLKKSGYLLRGWLSVQKIAEVKEKVLDAAPKKDAPAPQSKTPPGKPITLPVTRDNWFSNVGKEGDGNNGGSSRLKLKSHQEMSIVDFDPSSLKGYVITGATLHVKVAGNDPLRRVTVSTVAAAWVEGTASSYEPQKGSSTFKHRQHPDVPWTIPGSDLCSVMLGTGGTFWRMADTSLPDKNGFQVIPVDPRVVAARLAGVSHGFLLYDDTGTEWVRQGDKVDIKHFPNRYIHSRESNKANAPYFTIYVGEKDATAPEKPSDPRIETKNLPAGEANVYWKTPADKGTGTIGFLVEVDGKPLPRYLIPAAGKAGETVTMRLRDFEKNPGGVLFKLRAVDGAGNVSEPAEMEVAVSNRIAPPLPGKSPTPFTEQAALPKLGNAEAAIIDELDKVQPTTGAMMPKQADAYLAANHLWSAKEKRIRLHAARNEFVAFQVLLNGAVNDVVPSLSFENAPNVTVEWSRYQHVQAKSGPMPDPLVPLLKAFTLPEGTIEGQKAGSLHADIYVPHALKAGDYHGKLLLKAVDETLEIAVDLRVWDFQLPDTLSFLAEMNGYGSPGPEPGYFRVGHRHRTCVNLVPYTQSGNVHDGWSPKWDGKKFDWTAWDARFGPYFDGSAFADLPRKNVPLPIFYLPLHENWPTPVEGNYLGGYWADQAFTPKYRQNFVEASRQFAEHFNTKKWDKTLFHGFLNNKFDFKKNGWSRTSALWILDEPSNFQDFWALRWFATAFHEGVAQARGPAKMLFRADVSRPQWQRDSLDGLLDYNVVSGVLREYPRIVMDRKRSEGQLVVEYGNSNAIEDSNTQPLGWCLDAWSIGADGVLPWLTIGKKDSWEKAETTCLFYPARQGEKEPTPSVRLKAYRRGQQDVEYLTLLAGVNNQPRWEVGMRVRETLKLAPVRQGTGFTGGEDAGILTYKQLLPQDAWALRVRLGEELSQRKPESKAFEWSTPLRDTGKVAGRMVGAD